MSDFFVSHDLDPDSLAKAVFEGERRQSINERMGLVGRNMGPASGSKALDIHVLGAKGELAAAQ
jgi:hypothetical protein